MSGILTIGDPILEQPCRPVEWPDPDLSGNIERLGSALEEFRRRTGFGRAISAPQVSISKRIIYANLGATPFVVINPEVFWYSPDTFEVWDDCLSVPDSVVRVRRFCSISISYQDENGRRRQWERLPPDLSELMQHEIDHLDGILMTGRAIDETSIRSITERDSLVGPCRPSYRLSLDRIAEAARKIDPVFLHSPQYVDESLSAVLGTRLTFKLETANPIRSFKGRGADFFIRNLDETSLPQPLVCASAGNFGQAMAYACRRYGLTLTVFASENASPPKIRRIRGFGASVILRGQDFDAAKNTARLYAESEGARMVEDGREAEISEGAGSIAVELLAGGDTYDSIVIPLGNGALLTGIARWFKAASPATRVIGVCSRGADAMEKSWRAGRLIEMPSVSTIADGIAVRVPISEALSDMQNQVDDILLVDDNNIIEAMRLLVKRAGVFVEPAGAAGVAAILQNRSLFAGHHVATVLCGSNMTPETMLEILSNTRQDI